MVQTSLRDVVIIQMHNRLRVACSEAEQSKRWARRTSVMQPLRYLAIPLICGLRGIIRR